MALASGQTAEEGMEIDEAAFHLPQAATLVGSQNI